MRDLVLWPDSGYAPVHELAPQLKSNWGTVVVFNLASMLAGVEHAEKLVAGICQVCGSWALAYSSRSLDPSGPGLNPLANFLLNAWFLWVGFYNSYLAMVCAPFLAGYYIRHERSLAWRKAAALSAGLTAHLLVHVVAAALKAALIAFVALWVTIVARLRTVPVGRVLREAHRSLAKPAIAMVPVMGFGVIFVASSPHRSWSDSGMKDTWDSFPKHVFTSSTGRAGEQLLLSAAMIFYMIAGVVFTRAREWASARGAMAAGSVHLYAGYLFIPDYFLGCGEMKMRFSWAVFMIGCLAAASAARMRSLRPIVAVYTACCLAVALHHAMEHNVRRVSLAVGQYLSFLDQLPRGASFVRLKCPLDNTRRRFGYNGLPLEPLWHADSLAAAMRGSVNLSDYQAATMDFRFTFEA